MLRVAVILILLQTAAAFAADTTAPVDDSARTVVTVADSAAADIKYKSMFVERDPESSNTQKPTTALFKSMLIPGWGQVGNKKYIKAVIFAGLESLAFGTYWHYRTKTDDARDNFDAADENSKSQLYTIYQDARDDRNRFAWYTGSLIFISMFDAYVDAHLIHFPKRNESISLKMVPTGDSRPALALSYNF